jgi:hypothetical protein
MPMVSARDHQMANLVMREKDGDADPDRSASRSLRHLMELRA